MSQAEGFSEASITRRRHSLQSQTSSDNSVALVLDSPRSPKNLFVRKSFLDNIYAEIISGF